MTHHDVDGCVDLRVAALQEELERLGELVRLAVEVARLQQHTKTVTGDAHTSMLMSTRFGTPHR